MSKQHPEDRAGERPAEPDADAGLPEDGARRLASGADLGEALQRLCAERPAAHLTLSELQDLAKRRREDPAWAMTEHLSSCPICLELFSALLDGAPAPSPEATDRFVRLFRESEAPGALRLRWHALVLRAAAAVLAAVLAGLAYRDWTGRSPPSVAAGQIERIGGRVVAAGSDMPARTQVTARENSTVMLADGTSLNAAAGSVFSFARKVAGDPVFNLDRGELLVTAARQPAGSSLAVRTPLGTVRVVGTVFRVTLGSEEVVVHETRSGMAQPARYASSIDSVTVAVQEGVVSVDNRHERVLVPAGRAAVMRQGQMWIELR